MDNRLREARRLRPRQEPGDTYWSKLKDYAFYFGIQGPPRAASTSVCGKITIFSAKNVLIMICKSGCQRSVAHAESWSNMLTRNGRLPHYVSPLDPSELDFRKDTCAGKCSEWSKQSAEFYQMYYCFHAECSQLASASDSTTEYWKQLRRKCLGHKHEGSKSLRSTSITTTPVGCSIVAVFKSSLESMSIFAFVFRALPTFPEMNTRTSNDEGISDVVQITFIVG